MQQAYERAFQEFSDRVRDLQCLNLHPRPDAAAINMALLELEKAHWVYDRCRDELAVERLRSPCAVLSAARNPIQPKRTKTVSAPLRNCCGKAWADRKARPTMTGFEPSRLCTAPWQHRPHG